MARLVLNKGTSMELDISQLTFKYKDIKETPIYVSGENAGYSKAGTSIWDRVHRKTAKTIPLRPIPASILDDILSASDICPQTVEYETAKGIVTVRAAVTVGEYSYAMEFDGEKIYHGVAVTVEEE